MAQNANLLEAKSRLGAHLMSASQAELVAAVRNSAIAFMSVCLTAVGDSDAAARERVAQDIEDAKMRAINAVARLGPLQD